MHVLDGLLLNEVAVRVLEKAAIWVEFTLVAPSMNHGIRFLW